MRRYLWPVLALLFLAPVMGELFLGATPVSRLDSSLPLIFLYGGGALIIRDLARRHGQGWWRIIVLGLAYGLIEEGLATQSTFNPDLFNAGLLGGRVLGVNGIWTEWTLGYHVVFSIVLPIQIVEMMFPAVKDEPWLGRKTLAAFAIAYALSATLIAVVFRKMIAPSFSTPWPHFAATCVVIAMLVVLAICWPDRDRKSETSRVTTYVPPPWLAGLIALVASCAWFFLLIEPGPLKTGWIALIPFSVGLIVAAGTPALIARWSSQGKRWTPRHQLSMIIGSLPPVMLFGYFIVTAQNRVDQIGQGLISLAGLGCLSFWAVRMGKGEKQANKRPELDEL